jgi:hypothetical protein
VGVGGAHPRGGPASAGLYRSRCADVPEPPESNADGRRSLLRNTNSIRYVMKAGTLWNGDTLDEL